MRWLSDGTKRRPATGC